MEKYCRRCGLIYNDDSVYCNSCGNRLVYLNNPGKPVFNVKLTAVVACLLIIAIVLCCLIFTQKPNIDEERFVSAIMQEYATILGGDVENFNPFLTALYEGFEVEILSVSVEDDRYIVKCALSNYDVAAAYSEIERINSELTYKDFMNSLAGILTAQSRLSKTVELIISSDNTNEYRVFFTEEQLDAAMGGYISLYKSMNSQEEKQ